MLPILRKHSFLALLAALILLMGLDYGWLNISERTDQAAGDMLLRWHASSRPAHPDVVVVDIDQKSLEDLNAEAGNWPWPRAIHGEMVEGIARQKPLAIVFDIFFNEPDTFRLDSDRAFAEAVKANPSVYLPTVLQANGQGAPAAELPPILQLQNIGNTDGMAPPLLLQWVLPKETWRGGLVNFEKDSDGVGRHYLMYADAAGWRMPSMPARLAHDLAWKHPGTQRMMINWQTGMHHVHFSDLYLDFNREKPQRPADEFTGKVVIIGTAAPGLQDFRPTPLNKLYPGVDILATAISNLKHGDWLVAGPRWAMAPLGILFMGLVALGFQRRINTLWLAGGLLLASLLVYALQWYVLSLRQFWPMAGALLWVWIYFWLGALLSYIQEKAKSAHAQAMFGRFLDPRVVKDLVESDELNPAQQAEAREITVLFSDIRGFTTLSESHPPEFVVNLLNRYFTRQVEVIFRHGGTLDKFIGDAIMAFWGAPVNDPNHARHAVAAALEMSKVLEDFRKELSGLEQVFEVGIGVHSGQAVVGFIGSQARLDYTVIGDTVNLSSRIEGLTKGISRILVSEATRDACADTYDFVSRGSHTVKGREHAVELFEPKEKA